jgi:hypothetical protein
MLAQSDLTETFHVYFWPVSTFAAVQRYVGCEVKTGSIYRTLEMTCMTQRRLIRPPIVALR